MTHIYITEKSRDVLNQLSDLSKIPIAQIVEEWTNSLDKVLDGINSNRISLLSTNKKGVVFTMIAPLIVGSSRTVPDNEKAEREFLEKEVEKIE